jgi:hypothetical protein
VAEHYLDVLSVRLLGYVDAAAPENLAEEIALQVEVGARVDVEQLVDELKEDIGEGSRSIHQSITETDWGASGAGAEIIIEVPIALTVTLPFLWDKFSGRILRRGQPVVRDAQTQAESARASLAKDLGIGADTIKIVGFEPVGEGHRVELETPIGIFELEVDGGGVRRMRRR